MSELFFWLLIASFVVVIGGVFVAGYRAEVRREKARAERARRLRAAVDSAVLRDRERQP